MPQPPVKGVPSKYFIIFFRNVDLISGKTVTSPLELVVKIKMGKVSQVGDIMRYFGIWLSN
jgi:hypothetical protein